MDRMDRSVVIPVDNETESSTSRVTIDGRTITYKMTVLQQPVRARACGQGAKSSADRRPVDPPPIVELKIYEGENKEQDITFTMHANYFLFASLEHARPMAHGRVSQERNTPVLTGTPVAGMVYLDRPSPAGYFIFPDLSVRHEGKYRLSFSLFEELKNPKDEDKMIGDVQPNATGDAHVSNRLEVKSEPFQVYSAKKFPGLTESTNLSRVVAEQGCRVRIRRDVRMRRRDTKGGGKEWDDYEDETAHARARMSSTPESSVYTNMHTPHAFMDPIARPRSASNASHHSLGGSLSRRTSLQDMNQAYQQPHYSTGPHTPQSGMSTSSQYGPSPTQAYAPAPFVQAPAMPPPPQFAQQCPPPPPQAPSPMHQQNYYQYPPQQGPQVQQPQQQFNAPPPPPGYDSMHQQQRQSIEYSPQPQHDFRRNSMQQNMTTPPNGYAQQPPQHPSYPSQITSNQQTYQQIPPPPPPPTQPSHGYSSSIEMYQTRPAPLEPMVPSSRSAGATTPINLKPTMELPPLQTTMHSNTKLEASSPISAAPQSSYFPGQAPMLDTHKRSYGNVFSDRHQNQPLRQGARPNLSNDYGHMGPGSSMAEDDEHSGGDLDPTALSMAYRRADGRQIMRALPGNA
ncbi:Developmental and secondary metabolism regulator veA [Pseudocercospora fuligena]|uniref:Developmental and secondary metabolism regulator veA n=1 Tax=Pseudocercospora fuligena TaxID=685502 RepID=A0A8H6RT79_9PEZI|nr:Developmental and secondary metabolism regulator veA [Pseudocercospora fuligena]